MNIELLNDSRNTRISIPSPRRLSSRTVMAWAIWLFVAANAVAIVWLWWYGGNISDVHGLGDLWTSIGRITGLLSAYLALIQVLLLARLPFLDRLVGFDRLTVWHRLNGKITLYLVLAHVVFITVGYASMDQIPVPDEISRLLSSYPGMIAATIGTGLMILVVVSSLVIVRNRLRYEAWYFVHVTVYAAIALAWFHQIPTGNELTADPTASDYWISLYLATLALLLLFRAAVPIVHAFRYQLRVAEVSIENHSVVSLRITGRHLDRLHVRAGQFFLWRFLTRGRWWESHPFSLSEAPDGRSLRISVKNSGDFTGHMGEIPVGTRVIAEGPFGVFTDVVRQRDRVLLIAGGIGITPIRALVEQMPGDLTLIYRVVHQEDVVFRAELGRLARDRGITLHYVVGDHNAPDAVHLMSSEHLRQLVPDITERDVFLCGPPVMTRVIEKNVLNANVPRTHIHIERFAL